MTDVLKFNPNNAQATLTQMKAKLQDELSKNADLKLGDVNNVRYEDNFKKADKDGDGSITRDEYKSYVTDAVSSSLQLGELGDALKGKTLELLDTLTADFLDDILGDAAGTTETKETTATTEVKDSAPVDPSYDQGKTWANLRDEKIKNKEMLNFGHEAVDGQLWEAKDGEVVWKDTGTKVSRDQLAAMPDYQLEAFGKMMGIVYDQSSVGSDDEIKRLQAGTIIPDPPKLSDPAKYDHGKTLTGLREEKIKNGEMLNFGHKPVDGSLFKVDGDVVWADSGKKVAPEQLAAMPDYQITFLNQLLSNAHGLPIDHRETYPDLNDEAKRQALSKLVMLAPPKVTSPEASKQAPGLVE